jgi:hypothetical protein
MNHTTLLGSLLLSSLMVAPALAAPKAKPVMVAHKPMVATIEGKPVKITAALVEVSDGKAILSIYDGPATCDDHRAHQRATFWDFAWKPRSVATATRSGDGGEVNLNVLTTKGGDAPVGEWEARLELTETPSKGPAMIRLRLDYSKGIEQEAKEPSRFDGELKVEVCPDPMAAFGQH